MVNPPEFQEKAVKDIQNTVNGGKSIIAFSGGGDSSSCLKIYAISGERGKAIFVDNGYLRKGEVERVREYFESGPFSGYSNIEFEVVDASEEFYAATKGITDPEEKRKAIGHKFIEVFERHAKPYGADFLVQGTIAPDWIESGGGLRANIKSHHNVGGLPEKLGLKLIEPIRDLYKDEVREILEYYDIPVKQPFPGPGLAIRIMGEATPERTAIVREACYIVETEFEEAAEKELEKEPEDREMVLPWQYFAVLLPVKSVGVQGDVRSYTNTIVIRAVESMDAMTAKYSPIPHEVLERVSTKITNTMKDDVGRAVYDITNKPPGTVEWE